MKVRKTWLVIPILLVMLLVGIAVYAMNYFQIEKSDTGYTYKEELFVEDELGTVEITVSNKNWQTILNDPMAEEYVEASVTINGDTYDNVGIRAKGNSSLMSVASSDSERYSLKVDFAQYDNNQTYYGLETLNLNNNFSDSTQMKEFVSYELMEQLGVATPAHSYVKVMVNGEYYGLMLAVEEIGEAFAVTNYGSTNGFIFKPEDAGSDLKYVSDEKSDYSEIFNEAKMNKQTAENNSNVVNMMKEISEGDTSSLDVEQIASYFALNTALVNMDSYQGSFKHNYYLREDENSVFSVIPWDYNMSFGGFSGGASGEPNGRNRERQSVGEVVEQGIQEGVNENDMARVQGETPEQNDEENRQQARGNRSGGMMAGGQEMLTDNNINFSITEPVSGTTVDERPLLKIILEDEKARALYDSYLEQIATELLTEKNILAITEPLETLLKEAVEEDPSKFTTTAQFLEGIHGDSNLAEFAKQRSESILKQLAGGIEGISGASSGFGGGIPPEMNGGDIANVERMPDFENMPNMDGQGGPLNRGDSQGRPERQGDGMSRQQVEASVSISQAYTTIGIALAVCLLAIGCVLFIGKRKYRRK